MEKFPSFEMWWHEQRNRQDDLGQLVRDLHSPKRQVQMFAHVFINGGGGRSRGWKLTTIKAFREYKALKDAAREAAKQDGAK